MYNIILHKRNLFLLIAMLIIVALPLFMYLDSMPLYPVDEGRVCNNTVGMIEKNNYIIAFYDGEPDMWNTKPPFTNWAQAACIKLFGINEISFRLPSALAAVFTCLMIFLFAIRYLYNPWIAFLWPVLLVTMDGYVRPHGTRTGDYDSMLTFFMAAYCLAFYTYSVTGKQRYIFIGCLCAALATLTKGIAGLLFLPAIFAYLIFSKSLIPFLSSRQFYLGILTFIVLVGGFYSWREAINPGYIASVIYNEFGRYNKILVNNGEDNWFYFNSIIKNLIPNIYQAFILLGLATGILSNNEKIKKLSIYAIVLVVFHLIVISTSKTKLDWYDMPNYPFLSLFACIGLVNLINLTLQIKLGTNWSIMPFFITTLIIFPEYTRIIKKQKSIADEETVSYVDYRIANYLSNCLNKKQKIQNYILVFDGYNAHHLLYKMMFKNIGFEINFKSSLFLEPKDTVIVSQEYNKLFIKQNYTHTIIDEYFGSTVYAIHDVKIGPNLSHTNQDPSLGSFVDKKFENATVFMHPGSEKASSIFIRLDKKMTEIEFTVVPENPEINKVCGEDGAEINLLFYRDGILSNQRYVTWKNPVHVIEDIRNCSTIMIEVNKGKGTNKCDGFNLENFIIR